MNVSALLLALFAAAAVCVPATVAASDQTELLDYFAQPEEASPDEHGDVESSFDDCMTSLLYLDSQFFGTPEVRACYCFGIAGGWPLDLVSLICQPDVADAPMPAPAQEGADPGTDVW